MTVDDGTNLKADLKLLRKKPLRFAFGVKDAQTSELLLHKTKTARALGNELRGRGIKNLTFGTATAEDKVLVLRVEGKVLAGIEKKARLFLRRNQVTLYTEVRAEYEGDGQAQVEEATVASAAGRRALDAEVNAELEALEPEELAKEDLTQRDPGELFQDDYMDALVELGEKGMPGAGSDNLKEVMRHLAKGASGARREKLIAALALIVKADAGKLDLDYTRFLILRDQQAAIGKQKKKEVVPDLAEDIHDEFMASNAQLLFGKVLGDTFGIHPVFGALLSPTGGLVGGGNKSVQLDTDDPTAMHGIMHDAAGYLYNYHGQGPGYDYLDMEERDTAHELTGQRSGMRYWHEKLDPEGEGIMMKGNGFALDLIDTAYEAEASFYEAQELYAEGKKRAAELQLEAERSLQEARNQVAEAIDEAMDAAARRAYEVEQEVARAADEVERAAARAADEVERAVTEAADQVERAASEAADEVERAVAEAADEVERAANEAASAARDAIEDAERAVVQTYDDAVSAVGAAAEEASDKLEAAWDYLWS